TVFEDRKFSRIRQGAPMFSSFRFGTIPGTGRLRGAPAPAQAGGPGSPALSSRAQGASRGSPLRFFGAAVLPWSRSSPLPQGVRASESRPPPLSGKAGEGRGESPRANGRGPSSVVKLTPKETHRGRKGTRGNLGRLAGTRRHGGGTGNGIDRPVFRARGRAPCPRRGAQAPPAGFQLLLDHQPR